MSLQGGKKLVKRSGEREIVYNVYKFMKTEPEVGIKIPLSKVQKLKQHVLAEELYVGYLKKVKMWKLVSQWYFQLRAISDQKFALQVS